MVANNCTTIRHEGRELTYEDVCGISKRIMATGSFTTLLIDLEETVRTTTSALAR